MEARQSGEREEQPIRRYEGMGIFARCYVCERHQRLALSPRISAGTEARCLGLSVSRDNGERHS
jgi:hypothetical protein